MDRKEMIRLLETHGGAQAKYLGVPSFDYQIAVNGEMYTISKDCIMKDEAGNEVDFETILQMTVEGLPENYFKPEEEQSGITEIDTLEVEVPMVGHSETSLRNIVNMIYSKQVHIKKALGLDRDILKLEFIQSVNDEEVQTIAHFKEAVKRAGAENCTGIEFDFNQNVIVFKFGVGIENPEEVDAITKFVALLCKSAKEQKYASFKPSADDNLKFTLRTWLIRLGFVGDEYKSARKVLLKSLEGNGAFRKPKESQEVAGI